jgi:hypothetical protein
VQIRFTRSARRHRTGKAHALYVMTSTEPTVYTNVRGETEYRWIGPDDRGTELEIAAVLVGAPAAGTPGKAEAAMLLVLHVMPARFRGRTPR